MGRFFMVNNRQVKGEQAYSVRKTDPALGSFVVER